MTEAPGLDGLGVLVTRPAHQATALCEAVERAGGRALRLPLLSIDGPRDAVATGASLEAARGDGWWLFASPNAVTWTLRLAPDATRWPARLAAAGRGTAGALGAVGRGDARCPAQDGAAGLLAMAALAHLRGERVTVLCGERSPARLADGLRARGAVVTVIGVYRRVRVPHPVAEVRAALTATAAAIVSSGGALEHLVDLAPEDTRDGLFALQLVLPSARVVEMARRLGFRRPPLVPARVGDEEFVRTLLAWYRDTGRHGSA
ncbi:MAG TPA: uroporphyrinogen-III synthase [Nevskiaceae bacterium]